MWVKKTEYQVDKAVMEAKHNECAQHRRETDSDLKAIRVILETFIPSIQYVDSRRNFADTSKDIAIWFAAISAGLAGIIYIVKHFGG